MIYQDIAFCQHAKIPTMITNNDFEAIFQGVHFLFLRRVLLFVCSFFKKKKGSDRMKTEDEKREYQREYHRKWREKNRERLREYNREYHRKWREKNREHIREYKREWYKDNPERQKLYNKRYRQKKMN